MHDHCESIRELMTAFVVGELDGALGADVETHCAECSECQSELESLRAISSRLENELSAATAPLELSASRRADLMEAARATHVPQASGRKVTRRAWARWAMPLAAAAMLVLVFSFVLRTDRESLDQVASVPKVATPAPQEQTLQTQNDPAVDPASLSTYGLIVPVARDLDAERRSLVRLANSRDALANYDYPPAYGLLFERDHFEQVMPYFGLDGPEPFFAFTFSPVGAI